MKDFYFTIIIVLLSVAVTGLSVSVYFLRRRLIHLSRWASQTYYEKNKLQLWVDRLLRQQERAASKENETTN